MSTGQPGETVTIKMSDCCHGGYKEIEVHEGYGSYEKDVIYECKKCNQLCKVIEMLVEEK